MIPTHPAYAHVSLGTDPEFFFRDAKTKKIIPSERILPSKENPLRCSSNTHGTGALSTLRGAVLHWDGLQGEFTVSESFCRQYLQGRIKDTFRTLKDLNRQHGTEVIFEPAVRAPKALLESMTPESCEFGCDPDFVSWANGDPNPIMLDPMTHEVRYAGGHIHVGAYDNKLGYVTDTKPIHPNIIKTPLGRITAVKLLDIIVGNLMVLLDQSEGATLRRKVYGKAGTYRETSWGFEYRVLSNFWLHHPFLMDLVFALVRDTVNLMFYPEAADRFLKLFPDPEPIITAINDNDKALAFQNWIRVRPMLQEHTREQELKCLYSMGNGRQISTFQLVEYIGMIGIKNFFQPDFQKSWMIDTPDPLGNGYPVEKIGFIIATKKAELTSFVDNYSPTEMYL